MPTHANVSLRSLKDFERIGSRLKKNLKALLKHFPAKTRTISGMTEWLGTSRGTCQRIVECANKSITGIDVILLMPGVNGWNKFLKDVTLKNIDSQSVSRITKLLGAFELILSQLSISHNALKNNLDNISQSGDDSSQYAKDCEELYKATSKLLGEQKQAIFCVTVAREKPGDSEKFLTHTLVHQEACKISKHGRPLFLSLAPVKKNTSFTPPPILDLELDIDQLATEQISFIKDYTSEKIHTQSAQFDKGFESLVITPDSLENDPIDITMYLNHEYGALALEGVDKIAAGLSAPVRNPVKHLYMIVFLEKKLAGHHRVEAGIHSIRSTNTATIGSLDELWFDRFPGSPDLMVVNPDINFSSKLQYIKANELINCVFDITDIDRENFNCYMLKVEYPIWSSVYRIYFNYDFSSTA